jgi:lysozyme
MKNKIKTVIFISLVVLCSVIALFALLYTGTILLNEPYADQYPVRGVDVSSYQGEIDWEILSSQNIRFAFIKATEGSSFIDPYYETNFTNARKTELRIGAYHFFSYDSSGFTQAENFISVVDKYDDMLPPVVDVEFYGDKEKHLPEKDSVQTELGNFIQSIELHYGVKPIIYATEKSYRLYIAESFTDCDIWIRNVITKPKLSDGRQWKFWQYTNRKKLDGYSGEEKYIDMNVFNGTIEEFNSYVKSDRYIYLTPVPTQIISKPAWAPECIGNTTGNLSNHGLAAMCGEWIYYKNSGDKGSLYKIRSNGTDKTKLNDDNSYYINVLNDWIYYLNYDDGSRIYKINTNGTGRAKLNNDESGSLIVTDDWIYYENVSNNRALCKIRTDGSSKTILVESGVYDSILYSGWIYYGTDNSDGFRISSCKIRIDGKNHTRFTFGGSVAMDICDDWIYYSDSNELRKIHTDGTGWALLSKDRVWGINVVGDWVYYISKTDSESISDQGVNAICKIRKDGSEKTVIYNINAYWINIVDDWIYFRDATDNKDITISRMRIDGTEMEIVD